MICLETLDLLCFSGYVKTFVARPQPIWEIKKDVIGPILLHIDAWWLMFRYITDIISIRSQFLTGNILMWCNCPFSSESRCTLSVKDKARLKSCRELSFYSRYINFDTKPTQLKKNPLICFLSCSYRYPCAETGQQLNGAIGLYSSTIFVNAFWHLKVKWSKHCFDVSTSPVS